MTSLINFIDTGFIITLGLLILISGLVMLYCYRRLNLLENSVIEHGKILQNFILNYNSQTQQYNQLFKTSNLTTINEENNSENIEKFIESENNIKKINLEDKIDVSDNDDSDSDDDSDDDSEDEDNENIENDDKSVVDSENSIEEINNNLQIQPSDIQSDESLKNENFSTVNLESSNEEDDFLNNVPINIDSMDFQMKSKIIDLNIQENNLSNEDNKLDKKKNYSKMKVDDLRVLVVTNNLTSNEDAQNMKKNDLIKLIQH
jgi:hypothetical protein